MKKIGLCHDHWYNIKITFPLTTPDGPEPENLIIYVSVIAVIITFKTMFPVKNRKDEYINGF